MKKGPFALLACLFVLFSFRTQAQSHPSPKWRAAYGPTLFLPSSGLGHQVSLERSLIQRRDWAFRAELSYLHAGPYWNTFYSREAPPLSESYTIEPSLLRIGQVTGKLEYTLKRRRKTRYALASGVTLSYGLIEVEERTNTLIDTLDPNFAFGISTSSSFATEVRFRGGFPIQLIMTRYFNKVGVSLIPQYVHIGRRWGSLGMTLGFDF